MISTPGQDWFGFARNVRKPQSARWPMALALFLFISVYLFSVRYYRPIEKGWRVGVGGEVCFAGICPLRASYTVCWWLFSRNPEFPKTCLPCVCKLLMTLRLLLHRLYQGFRFRTSYYIEHKLLCSLVSDEVWSSYLLVPLRLWNSKISSPCEKEFLLCNLCNIRDEG